MSLPSPLRKNPNKQKTPHSKPKKYNNLLPRRKKKSSMQKAYSGTILPKSLSQASLVQDILALCSQRQFLSTRERKGSDVAKKKQLKLILLIGQGLAHSECVGWGIFLKWKNPAVIEDCWSQTRRYLNCVDFEHSILKMFHNLSSLISSQLLHLLQRNPHIKKNREERKVSEQLIVSWHRGISHKLTVQCRNPIQNKKELSHKWFFC